MAFRVDVVVKAVTDKSVLCEPEDVALGKVWVAKSLLTDDSEITEDSVVGEKGTLEVPSWLAKQEGWE
jgi:hypothetical protein